MKGIVRIIMPETTDKIDAATVDHPWIAAVFQVAATVFVVSVVIPCATVEIIIRRVFGYGR